MKLKLYAMFVVATVFILPEKLKAQQILAFKFTYQDNGKQWLSLSTTTDSNLEKSELSRVKGAQDNSASSARSIVTNRYPCQTMAEAEKNDAYFEFFTQVKPGYIVSLKDLRVILRAQENSSNVYRWVYCINGGNTFMDLGPSEVKLTNCENDGSPQESINLSLHTVLQNLAANKKVIFRLCVWEGSSSFAGNRAFGIGKSSSQGSNVISLIGYVIATNNC